MLSELLVSSPACLASLSLVLQHTTACSSLGSAAYLVFIGQNVSSMFNGHGFSVASCIFLLVPVEIGSCWIGMGKLRVYMSRAMVVMVLVVLASCMPAFGMFTSLVGSTLCALISFVLPATFHVTLFGSSLRFWQKTLDFSLFYRVDYFLRYMVLTMP